MISIDGVFSSGSHRESRLSRLYGVPTSRHSGGAAATNQRYKSFHYHNVHVCELLETFDDLLPRPAPFAPSCEKFAHSIQKWLLCSDHNQRTASHFRSKAAIVREKRRQILLARIIIHPFSRLNIIRDAVVCLMLQLLFIISPLECSFNVDLLEDGKTRINFMPVMLIANFVIILDIVMNFYTGYLTDNGREIVLNHVLIRKRYLFTYFLLDTIPTVYDLMLCFSRDTWLHPKLLLYPLNLLRLTRCGAMLRNMSRCLSYFHFRETTISCCLFAFVTVYLVHWCCCFFYYLPVTYYYRTRVFDKSFILSMVIGTENRNMHSIYVECLMVTTIHFFGVGTGSFKSMNAMERMLLAIVCIFGLCFQIGLIAYATQVFGNINISERKYEELNLQLKAYMAHKKITKPLRDRIYTYFNYKFNGNYFDEMYIMSTLSEHLRCEVELYSSREFVDRVRLFQGASKALFGTVLSMFKQEIYLQHDEILSKTNRRIYFIGSGTVAIYLPDGREVGHFEDGHHFGEISMMIEECANRDITKLVAVETTKVFFLDEVSLNFLIDTFPEIGKKLWGTAREKWALFKHIVYDEEEIEIHNEILAELKAGKILERPKPRFQFERTVFTMNLLDVVKNK